MITNITLQNFKCFRHLEINPKQLTILIGPNGTGKSTVLQSLLLLKQSAEYGRIMYQGDVINLNGRADVAPNFLDIYPSIYFGFSSNQYGIDFHCYFRETDSPALCVTDHSILEQLCIVPAVRGLVRPRYPLQPQHIEQIPPAAGLDAQEAQLASTPGLQPPNRGTPIQPAKKNHRRRPTRRTHPPAIRSHKIHHPPRPRQHNNRRLRRQRPNPAPTTTPNPPKTAPPS